MSNSFPQIYIDEANNALGHTGTFIKRSRLYTRAVVMGRPDVKGSFLLSPPSEATGYWLVHFFHNLKPKEVADGEALKFNDAYESRFSCWNDVLHFLTFAAPSTTTSEESAAFFELMQM